ncbi:proton-coupled folate transporter-like isoform X2 [Homalodisca vitripennis]|uniref:proton-coupled folate transporter-like isoform X2 n=1 Tax=Homalodisca vitripennis TaxID=197043 RepID=UPI001EECB527|nr:proton-coupled folate transporter-like isoform X2 [Homalodisca vitripennis]
MSFIEIENEERRKLLSGGIQANYGDVIIHSPSPTRGSTIIEPVLLMFLLAKTLSDTVITNLLEYRTCRVLLELPHDNCTDPVSPNVEDLVQPTTAHIITGRALLEAFVPSCMAVLIGPWSDANGRKPFMVISLAGISLTYFCWGCLSLLPNLHPYVFLLASLPMSLSGGSCAVYLLTYCYISDVTDEHTRSFRMAGLMTAFAASNVFGVVLAPLLMDLRQSLNPYPSIFFLSAFLQLVSAFYTHWYIQESVHVQLIREKVFLTLSHVRTLFSACFRHRRGNARPMILLLAATLILRIFIIEGEEAILYLSVREMFSWQLHDYSAYFCFNNIVIGVGALVGVWLFTKVLGIPNTLSVAIVFSAHCLRSTMMAIASSSEQFYYASLVSIFVTTSDPICHTELSRIVPQQELGKVFALTSILESFTPIGAAPLYTFVYRNTFLQVPGAVFLVSAALSITAVLMVSIVFRHPEICNGRVLPNMLPGRIQRRAY